MKHGSPRLRRWYGAGPLHLLLLLASFVLALYAGVRLLADDWFMVAVWFVGAALLHDLVLVPVYAAADRAVTALLGRHDRRPPAPNGVGAGPAPDTPPPRVV
ncbi:hypothetical protein ACFWJH_40635, partial [Streptomyces lasiicapitis]